MERTPGRGAGELRIGCVLMAAGLSTRFGGNKLLHPLDGRTLIERALDALPAAMVEATAVVASHPEIMKAAAEKGCMAVWNEKPESGVSHTIRLGLAALGSVDAAMFMVGDQPMLTERSVSGLVGLYRENPGRIVCAGYGGARGNPCIFPAAFFPQLAALAGDVGGSAVIKCNEGYLLLYEVRDASELADLDYAPPCSDSQQVAGEFLRGLGGRGP